MTKTLLTDEAIALFRQAMVWKAPENGPAFARELDDGIVMLQEGLAAKNELGELRKAFAEAHRNEQANAADLLACEKKLDDANDLVSELRCQLDRVRHHLERMRSALDEAEAAAKP